MALRVIRIDITNLVKVQQKSLSDMWDYRPSPLVSLISKLLECVILQRCGYNLEASDNQFVYKAEQSTDMTLFTSKQVGQIKGQKNSIIHLCFESFETLQLCSSPKAV